MSKKIIIALTLMLLALPLRAQWYVGGGLIFNHSASNGISNFSLQPDVGYSWGRWSFGTAFSFDLYGNDDQRRPDFHFEIDPYVEYVFWESGILSFYVEGGCSFRRFISDNPYNQWTPYIRPGLALEITEHWAVQGTIGRLEYNTYHKTFFLEMDNGISVGLYYNF